MNAQFVSTVLSLAKKKSGKPGKLGRRKKIVTLAGVIDGNTFASAAAIFKAANELLKLAGDKVVAKDALDMVAALRG